MFEGAGVRTVAGGNIGTAFSAFVRQSGELDVATLEVSSFQLEDIRTFRPHIAAWLNFTPDHLDRYRSMEEYRAAKLRIFENQTADDWAILNLRDVRDGIVPAPRARVVTFSATLDGGDYTFVDGVIRCGGEAVLALADTRLRGAHNAENLMAALAIGRAWGLEAARMLPGLVGYRPQAHRCETIREVGGVLWINDSKATNLDSVEQALRAVDRPVVLVAGGKDKGFDYAPLREPVADRCRAAVLIGEMAERIERDWAGAVNCTRAPGLAEAVAEAARCARPGDAVLFSPGTSSFDMFRDYRDRGDQFRRLVLNLPENP
jgi:UDP-N-acetylmuramoylalanine--D-glutamate ligase